jgi:hypothetical protein
LEHLDHLSHHKQEYLKIWKWISCCYGYKCDQSGSFYVDGVNQGTVSTAYPTSNQHPIWILVLSYDTSYSYNGYVQDFRIYKGLAKYTSNFIPASTDPDIVPDSPSGVSYSSNVALVPSTDGAVAFDGTNAYLQVTPGTDLTFGTNPFTIEMFVYKGPSTSTLLLYDHRNAGGGQGLHPTLYYSSGTLYYYVNGSNLLSTTNYKTKHLATLCISSFYCNKYYQTLY